MSQILHNNRIMCYFRGDISQATNEQPNWKILFQFCFHSWNRNKTACNKALDIIAALRDGNAANAYRFGKHTVIIKQNKKLKINLLDWISKYHIINLKAFWIICLLSILNKTDAQTITGCFSYLDGKIYNVAEELTLKSDSTYSYILRSDLLSKKSFGKFNIINDTLYFESTYIDYIKSVTTTSNDNNCIYISISNFESLNTFGLYGIVYLSNGDSTFFEIDYLGKAEIGQLCIPLSSKEREILEFKLKNIDKIEKVYYSYSEVDSIRLYDFQGTLGFIHSSQIRGSNVELELLGRNYEILNNEKCYIKNKRKIFWIHKGERARLLKNVCQHSIRKNTGFQSSR